MKSAWKMAQTSLSDPENMVFVDSSNAEVTDF